jgi:hypothetical protein
LYGDGAWLFYNGQSAVADNLDFWTPENPNALNPRPTGSPTTNNTQMSNHWLRDASYLRLKSATLTFSIPSTLSQKIGIQNAKIFVAGQNLLTFTKLKNYDPEIGNSGVSTSGRGWPMQKVVSIGVNISL